MRPCRFWVWVVLGCILASFSAGAAPAARKAPVPVVRVESAVAPIISVSSTMDDARYGLETAETAWEVFASTLHVAKPPEKTRIILQWVVVADPQALPAEEFEMRVKLERGRKMFVIERYGEARATRDLLLRSLMNAYLQALAWDGQDLVGVGSIPRAPYWLAEGLVQKARNKQTADMVQIISRLDRTKTLPKLTEVQSWQDGGEFHLERLIRRAVAFWLLRQATAAPVECESLKVWWQSQRKVEQARYWEESESREVWWREVARNRAPQDIPIMTWEQTANHLREAMVFSARLKGEKESRMLSIVDLPDSPADLEDAKAVKEVERKLSSIQLQANWLWQYVLAKYSGALNAWSGGNYPLYRQKIREALILQQRMDAVIKRTEDYLDWFTVNYGLEVDNPDWENYRKLVREIEKAREGFEGKRATDGT